MHNRLLESSDSNEERKPVEALHHRYRAGARGRSELVLCGNVLHT